VADGFLTVAALEPDFWAAFCLAIEREDLKERQFDAAAIELVQATLLPEKRAEWMVRFGDLDVCVEPSLELDETEG
jgi:alpha-methylacyl-CoA racemase